MSTVTDHTPGRPLRVGIVGAGLIAQVAHLPYLRELSDRFDTVALCDIVPETAAAVAQRHGVPHVFTDWRQMLAHPLDAVIVLTTSSHAPIAVEAARRGLHVLVEKPMCLSVEEGRQMVAAADEAGVALMVGYNKRYDPAYERFRELVGELSDRRFLRVTTFEAPYLPYVAHYGLIRGGQPPTRAVERLAVETQQQVSLAIGEEASDFERRIYRARLLDSLIHELNALRGLLGEPDSVDHVDLRETSISVMLTFGGLPVAIHWVLLTPGITRYRMEFAMIACERRVSIGFPSPYLRNVPTLLQTEEGEADKPGSRASDEIITFESSFSRELVAFHEAATEGRQPPTTGWDSLRDVALCQAIVECFRSRRPIQQPSELR
ncbi:MAG TPA: Gfo/Idh/MocA family oxidoreductase [Candidatus Limnocylindrales bacterium]|nr:Gfo/Idh/MocA family oxidoreductase [Candidatus Limnocylindrales bacterium]